VQARTRPSSAESIAIVSSRAVAGSIPARSNSGIPAAIQLSNASAHACRIVSLVLDTSRAIVAIGHAST